MQRSSKKISLDLIPALHQRGIRTIRSLRGLQHAWGLHRTAVVVALCLLSSCATIPPKPNYEYADTGLALTSEPSDAKVDISIRAIRRKNGVETGRPGTNHVSFVTTLLDFNDKLLRHATLPDNIDVQFKYTVRVSRGGYRPILQEIDGRDIKSEFHWVLEPVDPGRLAAASNSPAAWARLESSLLNGRPLPENYFRHREIRHYLAEFVTALVESNLFVSASTERSDLNSDRIVEFRLGFREKENTGNPAFGGGQAFLSGLLTLAKPTWINSLKLPRENDIKNPREIE